MGSRLEILNAGRLRLDGRKPLEFRSLAIEVGSSSISSPSVLSRPDGCARVQQGLTSVHASVYGPREARSRGSTLHDRAILDVEVEVDPWSGRERRKRSKGDRRTTEIEAAIKATFEPVLHLHLFPRSEVSIFVTVEHQDGGVLSCAINTVTLALLDAGIPMSDYVLGVCAGMHLASNQTLIDLSALEEGSLPSLIIAYLARSRTVTLAQLETRIHADALPGLVKIAGDACAGVLLTEVDAAMRARTKKLAEAMGGKGPPYNVAHLSPDDSRSGIETS